MFVIEYLCIFYVGTFMWNCISFVMIASRGKTTETNKIITNKIQYFLSNFLIEALRMRKNGNISMQVLWNKSNKDIATYLDF